MENLKLYDQVKAVPDTAKRTIGAGRLKGFTDINPMWRIKTLTEHFGPCGVGWYFKTIDKSFEKMDNGEILCFVTINLYVKFDGEWSTPIEGTGGSKIATMEKGGIYYDDEGIKKATTDALGIACKNLGIGADVWWSSDRTKHTTAPDQASAPKQAPAPEQTPAAKAASAVTKIGEQQLKILEAEIKCAEVPIETILSNYNVKSLKDMTAENYVSCMRRLKATKKMKEKTA